MKVILIFVTCLMFSEWAFCQTNALTNALTTQNTNILAQAKQKGETQAKADISKGTMQILYYGKPWSTDKPLVDDESGLPVKIVAGCDVLSEFVAETDAYNDVMLKTAKEKNKKVKSANKAQPDTR